VAPSNGAPAASAPLDRATIEALVDRVLAARKPVEASVADKPNPKPGGDAQPAPLVPAPPAPEVVPDKPKPKAVDFVCEEDVNTL